jgi:FMN phosphatase YigB (HAD superfamily)
MIKVFSTYTKDIVFNGNNQVIRTQKGGPAFFIENVFKKNKVRNEIKFAKADINIRIICGKEKGILADNKLKQKKVYNIKDNDTILVSTVDNEWMFPSKLPQNAKIFLDVQGYVRAAKKDRLIYKSNFWNDIFCIKGNSQEIKELPKDIIKSQKNKCLITTNGSRGATIYFKGRKHTFNTKNIKSRDTIGAGDTFFAGFIAKFIKDNGDIEKSGKYAGEEVGKFLSDKNEKNTKKTIIFDMDGTLYELKGGSFRSSGLYDTIIDNTLSYLSERLKKTNSDIHKILDDILEKYGTSISVGLEKEFKIDRYDYFNSVWDIDSKKFVEFKPGLYLFLLDLKKDFDLVLLSDAPRIWIDNVLKQLGIQEIFKERIFSGEGSERKEFGNAFVNICKMMDSDAGDCVVVGDQEDTDIIPAKKIGMKTVFIGKDKNKKADYTIDDIFKLKQLKLYE